MLQSVTHLNDTDHVVILDKQNSFMINKISGEVNQIDHDGKNFTMDLWVVPPEDLAGIVKEVNEKGFLGHLP